jgi:hypothetical protein
MNAQPEIVQNGLPERRSADDARRLFSQAGLDYERRRQARQRLESNYQTARERLIDGFRIELEELQHKAREAIRKIDDEHAERMAHEDRILAALDQLRQG